MKTGRSRNSRVPRPRASSVRSPLRRAAVLTSALWLMAILPSCLSTFRFLKPSMSYAVCRAQGRHEGRRCRATRRGWRVAARSSPESGGAIEWQCDLRFGEPNCVRCELSAVRGNPHQFCATTCTHLRRASERARAAPIAPAPSARSAAAPKACRIRDLSAWCDALK